MVAIAPRQVDSIVFRRLLYVAAAFFARPGPSEAGDRRLRARDLVTADAGPVDGGEEPELVSRWGMTDPPPGNVGKEEGERAGPGLWHPQDRPWGEVDSRRRNASDGGGS